MRQAESKDGPITAGDVVIFRSGYSDRFFKKFPESNRMMVQPLAGKAAGWPTPELEVITYLANKGVRLIGTDGPTLGGVDPQHAMNVYWLTGSHGVGLVGVSHRTGPDSVRRRLLYVRSDQTPGPSRCLRPGDRALLTIERSCCRSRRSIAQPSVPEPPRSREGETPQSPERHTRATDGEPTPSADRAVCRNDF